MKWPPRNTLRLEQKIRLFLAEHFPSFAVTGNISAGMRFDDEYTRWPLEIQKACHLCTEDFLPWPNIILPRPTDIHKLDALVSSLPPETRIMVVKYSDAQILHAIKTTAAEEWIDETNWLKNLKKSKFYRKIFSDSTGSDFIENLAISKKLSEFLEDRPDRIAVLSEFYDKLIRSSIVRVVNKKGYDVGTEILSKIVDVPPSIPKALSYIWDLSPNANMQILQYLKSVFNITADSFKNLTKMAKYDDSVLYKYKGSETNQNQQIGAAINLDLPGYTVIRKIDEGAYKEVWEVVEEESGVRRHLVYKKIRLLKDGSSHDDDNLKKAGGLSVLIRNELEQIEKVRKKITIPVPQLHKIFSNGWIEDYIEGENLKQKYAGLREQYMPINMPHLLSIVYHDFAAICDILIQLSKQNILHRDVKLENFIQDKNGQIYITDFGLSLSGIFGSRSSAAPEVIISNGKQYSEESDSWSLGVALYQAVFGNHPFGKDKHDIIKILQSKPETEKNVESVVKRLGNLTVLQNALQAAWQYEPSKRADFFKLKNILHSYAPECDIYSQAMKQSVDLISKMLNVDILDNIKNLAKEKGMDFPVHVLLQQNPFFHFLGQFYAGLRVYEQYYKKQMNPEMKEAIEKADQFMKRMISEAINDSIMKKK